MVAIDPQISIDDLLISNEAVSVYKHICQFFTDDEQNKYMMVIADYCNSRAFKRRIEKELASQDLIVEYTNKAGATNNDKNKLTLLLKDENAYLLSLDKELQLTPRTDKGGGDDEIDMSKLRPPAK